MRGGGGKKGGGGGGENCGGRQIRWAKGEIRCAYGGHQCETKRKKAKGPISFFFFFFFWFRVWIFSSSHFFFFFLCEESQKKKEWKTKAERKRASGVKEKEHFLVFKDTKV